MLHPFPLSPSHSAFLMGITCVSQALLPLGATFGLIWTFFLHTKTQQQKEERYV